jgi:hypothetical protein
VVEASSNQPRVDRAHEMRRFPVFESFQLETPREVTSE